MWWKNNPLYKKGLLPLPERQMLHAQRLGFTHPKTGKFVEFEAPVPEDMEMLIEALRVLEQRTDGKNAVDI
jgi:23S rRNA pseudouridine1911/1915/1917 synthase